MGVTNLPHQSDDLPSSSRLEVEVVHRGHAADLRVRGAGRADFLGRGHFEHCLFVESRMKVRLRIEFELCALPSTTY